jgi:sarcosine oxidase subunit beta
MEYDYVVVGGGVYGAGTAWELAERGADVGLFEADAVASGASGGLGKRGVRANGRDPRELPLMDLAYDLWPALADDIGAETGYERTGHLTLYERESGGPGGGYASAPARRWLQERKGVPTDLLDAEELRATEPNVSEDVVGALHCPDDGVADHTATTRGLASAAEDRGGDVHEGTPIAGVERDGDGVTAVTTEGGERVGVGEELLLLANVDVPRLLDEAFGVTLPVWRILPQVVSTEPLESVPVEHLIGHDSRTLALKEIAGDRVMISGGWRGTWNDAAGRGEVVRAHVEANVREAVATYPALADATVERADAGRPESHSVDGVPIIGRLPGVENLLFATGWTGHGFAISLAVNRLLADWAVTGSRPERLVPFGYERFLE